jgi:hypothetical protein
MNKPSQIEGLPAGYLFSKRLSTLLTRWLLFVDAATAWHHCPHIPKMHVLTGVQRNAKENTYNEILMTFTFFGSDKKDSCRMEKHYEFPNLYIPVNMNCS